jgi:selenocysteine lyase/cysteine desulfurase
LDDEKFWRVVRSQFPLTHERVYFNTGGLGPASYPVLDVMQRSVLEQQSMSEHGHHLIEEARPAIAAFFGADASEIAYMRNATEGNATVASGLHLNRGDEVIFESHAHPGGLMTWMSRQKMDGIKVKIFDPDPTSIEGNLNRIADLITDRTRVIQVSQITAPTGLRFPVEDIARLAHDKEIWFHVDGAQSAGMIPVDVHAIGCDSFATSCHKWMLAPHGTGVLYVKEDRLDDVTPTELGSYSNSIYELPDVFDYNATAQRYEPGTRSAAPVLGIAAAIDFLNTIGMDRIVTRGHGLAKYLQKKLLEIPGVTVLTPQVDGLSAAMTTFKTDRVPYGELNSILSEEFNLRCRVVSERGLDALRVSTHIFNFPEECDRLVEGTRAVLARAH